MELYLWEIDSGRRLHTLRPSSEPRYARGSVRHLTRIADPFDVTCAFSSDSALLATCQAGKKRSVRIWDVRTGQPIRSIKTTKANGPRDLADETVFTPGEIFFAADGKTLVVAGMYVVAYDITSGEELFSWHNKGPSNPQTQLFIGGRALEFPALRMLALSPDGTMAAGLAPFPDAPNKRIVLCDARNGKIIHTCDNSSDSAIATLSPIGYVNASFSDNGHLLVSSHGNSLDLWETATGAKLRSSEGHQAEIISLGFDRVSRRLVSASLDGTVLVWDLTGTRSAMNVQPLTARELENVWSDLSSADGVRGQKAVRSLLAVPDQAVTFLAKKLKPAATPDANVLARCLMELDSELFKTREECHA